VSSLGAPAAVGLPGEGIVLEIKSLQGILAWYAERVVAVRHNHALEHHLCEVIVVPYQ
jgi:hypothetical protein